MIVLVTVISELVIFCLQARVLVKMWEWFFVTEFSLPILKFPIAFIVVLLVGMLQQSPLDLNEVCEELVKNPTKGYEYLRKKYITDLLRICFAFLIGGIVHIIVH